MTTYDQLLTNTSLHPAYWIASDEPLLSIEACDHIRALAKAKQFSREIYNGFNAETLHVAWHHHTLFAEQKLIELTLENTPVKNIGQTLLALLTHNPLQHTLLIITPKIESATQKTAWFTELAKQLIFVPIWPIERTAFPAWIKRRLQKENLPTDATLVEKLCLLTEGNLLAAQQHMMKLSLLNTDLPGMLNALTDAARYTTFEWVASLLAADVKRGIRLLDHLQAEETPTPLMLFAIAQELQLAARFLENKTDFDVFCKTNAIWYSRKVNLLHFIKRITQPQLYFYLQCCAHIDRAIKGILAEDPWVLLSRLTLAITGQR